MFSQPSFPGSLTVNRPLMTGLNQARPKRSPKLNNRGYNRKFIIPLLDSETRPVPIGAAAGFFGMEKSLVVKSDCIPVLNAWN
jgi:hypothetical protein